MNEEAIPAFTVSAPGKVILHGEHSVVYGKPALAASLNLRTKLMFQSSSEGSDDADLELTLSDLLPMQRFNLKRLNDCLLSQPLPLTKEVDESMFNLEKTDLIDFPAFLSKIRAFLNKEVDIEQLTYAQLNALSSFLCILTGMFSSVTVPLRKFSVEITTYLTIGAGMGSSASYGVCIAAALLHYIRCRLSHTHAEGMNISKNGFKMLKFWCTDFDDFTDQEKKIVSQWAFLSERIMHGNPSGIDNTICTYGSIVQFQKNSATQTTVVELLPDPKILNILLVDSGVTRNTANMVAKVLSLRKRHCLLVNHILDAIDIITTSAAKVFKTLADTANDDTAAEEFVKEQLGYLGELINMNQCLLQALGVSHESLDRICSIVRMKDLQAKLTGAGGGGYAYVLLPPNMEQSKLDSVKNKLQSESFKCIEVQLGGQGVLLHKG